MVPANHATAQATAQLVTAARLAMANADLSATAMAAHSVTANAVRLATATRVHSAMASVVHSATATAVRVRLATVNAANGLLALIAATSVHVTIAVTTVVLAILTVVKSAQVASLSVTVRVHLLAANTATATRRVTASAVTA
jgi:hypothetical protein